MGTRDSHGFHLILFLTPHHHHSQEDGGGGDEDGGMAGKINSKMMSGVNEISGRKERRRGVLFTLHYQRTQKSL